MRYGHFDDPRREYVITNPRTPVRWINYLGTMKFGGFVDHTGGSLICCGDPDLNRITKYIPQLPASSFNGETLYLRIRQDDRGRVFSPFFVPTLDPFDTYECHVGLGYTRIISVFYGLRSEVTIFVPLGEQRLLRDIRVTNLTDAEVELSVVPVVEYTHPYALKQLTNADWVPQTMQSQALTDEGCTILVQYPFMFREARVNYFTSNLPASSFDTDRRSFLGENEYRSWEAPLSLEQGELSNSLARRGDNIAALMHHLGRLAPGETQHLVTQLGQAGGIEAARQAARRYRDPEAVERALEALERWWEAHLSTFQFATPDEAMNRLLNVHNPRQCRITAEWSRYLSLYQLGFGARGIGFRDAAQDALGILCHDAQAGKALIRQLLPIQQRDGSAMHLFYPSTMVASAGEAGEAKDTPGYYSDDHLWIVLAVTAYLKETGDLGFLEEQAPFCAKGGRRRTRERASVLEHMRRAVDFTWGDVGAHGLPRLGFADWNDTVNLAAGAESVFTANLLGRALSEMIELAERLGDEEAVRAYTIYYQEMRDRVNRYAWDGSWYVRYFDAAGAPLGSSADEHGRIYANAQSWSVLSGFAPPDRARAAMDSLYAHLNTRHGIKLSAPGYDAFDPDLGGITTYPPGAKENGGVFLHANPWAIIAEAMLGNGDRAFEYYAQINPAAKNERVDEYECEPYVYAQNILGDEHPQFGLARNSWLTGTAAWAWQAATMYILGVRPGYEGLTLDPCIPHHWPGFRARRRFRNARYEIEVRNPARICKGVGKLTVDGQRLDGRQAPIFNDGAAHTIVVTLAPDVPSRARPS